MIWADPSKTINSSPPFAIALIARHDDAVDRDPDLKKIGLYLLDPAYKGGQRGEALHRYTVTPYFEVPNGTLEIAKRRCRETTNHAQ
jgi:hypothetical protein